MDKWALRGHFYSFVDPVRSLYNIGSCFHVIIQVVFWVELPIQRRLCHIFVKSWVLEKGDSMVWCRVTRHPQTFLGLTSCQRTPRIWGITLDEGRPFNISSDGQLFDQCKGRLTFYVASWPHDSATNYPYGNRKNKRVQIVFSSGITFLRSNYCSLPRLKRKKKNPLAVDPLETIALGELKKFTYVSTLLSNEEKEQLRRVLLGNANVFAWSHSNMVGIDPTLASYKLNIIATVKPVRQKIRRFHSDPHHII